MLRSATQQQLGQQPQEQQQPPQSASSAINTVGYRHIIHTYTQKYIPTVHTCDIYTHLRIPDALGVVALILVWCCVCICVCLFVCRCDHQELRCRQLCMSVRLSSACRSVRLHGRCQCARTLHTAVFLPTMLLVYADCFTFFFGCLCMVMFDAVVRRPLVLILPRCCVDRRFIYLFRSTTYLFIPPRRLPNICYFPCSPQLLLSLSKLRHVRPIVLRCCSCRSHCRLVFLSLSVLLYVTSCS